MRELRKAYDRLAVSTRQHAHSTHHSDCGCFTDAADALMTHLENLAEKYKWQRDEAVRRRRGGEDIGNGLNEWLTDVEFTADLERRWRGHKK